MRFIDWLKDLERKGVKYIVYPKSKEKEVFKLIAVYLLGDLLEDKLKKESK